MIKITEQQIDFISQIYKFIDDLRKKNEDLLIIPVKKKSSLDKIKLLLFSLYDVITLYVKSCFSKNNSTLIFIAPNLINYETFLLNENNEKSIFINYHHTKWMADFNGKKIYNIGIIEGVLNSLSNKSKSIRKSIINANKIYNFFINRFLTNVVYIPCYYDTIGFSLIFEDNRTYKIIEIQHGSICNFFPFTKPATFKLVDEIYVDNNRTYNYLRNFLYKHIDVIIKLKNKKTEPIRKIISDKTILLYCSSIEIHGIHPVLLRFLERYENNFELIVRLHPREKSNSNHFQEQLNKISVPFSFDNSKDWTSYANQANLIVISPWSSVIEEACELGIISIIIDPFGKSRFQDMIDNKLCFYSDDLTKLFDEYKLL